jgi:hypothetical protein
LNQANADIMERFVSDYPTSTKSNQAFIEVAHYYFDQKLYYPEKVNESQLSGNDRDKFISKRVQFL